jgi:hypothetical protein
MANFSRSNKYRSRAEKYMEIDSLHKRVVAILTKTGLRNDPKAYLTFDLALYPMDIDQRRKILKKIFSPDGREIKEEHKQQIELLETFFDRNCKSL